MDQLYDVLLMYCHTDDCTKATDDLFSAALAMDDVDYEFASDIRGMANCIWGYCIDAGISPNSIKLLEA